MPYKDLQKRKEYFREYGKKYYKRYKDKIIRQQRDHNRIVKNIPEEKWISKWTKGEIKILKNEYPKKKIKKLMTILNRSKKAIWAKAFKLGLKKPWYIWVKEDYDLLRKEYPKGYIKRIAKKIGVSIISVHREAKKLGLKIDNPKRKGIPRTKEVKKKLRLFTANARKRGCYNSHPNKPEIMIINLIQQNNLNFVYVGDGKKIIDGFCPDFINEEKKLIIEHFGDYWHNKEKVRNRDEERLATYKKYGYKPLVIWQRELKNPNQVLNKIKEFYSSR